MEEVKEVKGEWESQAKDVLLPLQGEPGPPGMGVQGPEVSLQPYLCLPATAPPALLLASCPLPSALKTTERCPPLSAHGHSSGIELCRSLSRASVQALGFDVHLSDPQGLLGVLF